MTPQFTVQSQGAGVQSTTILLLAINGVLPKPDAAIFAATGWEPRAVYDQVDRLEALAAAGGAGGGLNDGLSIGALGLVFAQEGF